MKHFHIHVYFEPNCLEIARRWSARADLAGLFEFVKFHEKLVGPHPTGMIEAHFNESDYTSVLIQRCVLTS